MTTMKDTNGFLIYFIIDNCCPLGHTDLENDPKNFDINFYSLFSQQFGNKVGDGQFRGKAVPTYVYPDCLKDAIRERLSGQLQDYPNPETPAVSVIQQVAIVVPFSHSFLTIQSY